VWHTLLSTLVHLQKYWLLGKGRSVHASLSLGTMSSSKCLAMRAGVLCFHDGQLVADRRRGTVQMLKVCARGAARGHLAVRAAYWLHQTGVT